MDLVTRFLRIPFLVFALLFAVLFSYATEAGNTNSTVKVVRQDNGQPLQDAIVHVVPLKDIGAQKGKFTTGLTDGFGNFFFNITDPVIINISFLGFTSITDTLYTPDSRTFFIVPMSQNMNDVVVTGQYSANSIKKSVYEVKVITAEQLKTKGANNLREALQNELNIDLGQDAVFGSSLGINGISGEGVKIMVDGVPIVGRLDGKLDLSQINVNNIERIEIVEGPLSVIYGSDAMGGVINVITKTFQKEKVNLNLKAYYETVGQYNIELNAGFAFKKNQVYLSAGRNFFDGFTTLDTVPRFQEWKPKEQYFADAKYIYTGNRFRVSLLGSFFRELMLDRSAPHQALSYDNGDTTLTYVGSDYHYLTYRPRFSTSFMYRFADNNQLEVLLAYSGFIRFTNKYVKDLVTLNEHLVPDDSEQDTAYYHQILFRPTYTFPVWRNKLQFQFGGEVSKEYTAQHRIENGHQDMTDLAFFGCLKFAPVEGLDVQPAMRIIYNSRFPAPLVPSINFKYNYQDKVVARLSYSRGFRAPSLKELYLDFFNSDHNIQGNKDLKAETSHTVNASISYSQNIKNGHTISFTPGGFYNYITNKIDLVQVAAPAGALKFEYFNIKNYITYGADAELSYKWNRLMLMTSGMFTYYNLSNTTSKSDRVIMFSPDVTVGGSYTIPKAELSLNVSYKYNGSKPLFSVNSGIQAGTRADYHMLDVSLARNFWKDRIQIIVGGKNLLGVTNVATANVSAVGHSIDPNRVNIGWGRTFFTSLVLHFSK